MNLTSLLAAGIFSTVALANTPEPTIAAPTSAPAEAAKQESADELYKQGVRLKATLIRTLTWSKATSAEAVGLIRRAAEQGHPAAQFELASILAYGDGVEKDMTEGALWCRKAAEQGHTEAQFCMVSLSLYLPDNTRGGQYRWLQMAAENGHPVAQLHMGHFAEDEHEAASWYRKAAAQGYADAQVALALTLLNDDTADAPRAQEAVALLRKAAEQGCEDAYMPLARCLTDGRGTEKNLREAVHWLVKAAQVREDLAALDFLSSLAPLAFTEEDRAADLAAAEQGDAAAQFRLARMIKPAYPRRKIISIGWGTSADDVQGVGLQGSVNYEGDEEAAAWLAKAAEQGHAEAQRLYGLCCEFGDGCEANMEEAVRWVRCAAEQGDAEAQYILASYYFSGRGVAEDIQQAIHWFRKAAENGHAIAQANMGFFCSEDIGDTKANPDEALEWFRKAAEQGDANAISEYERRTGEPLKRN